MKALLSGNYKKGVGTLEVLIAAALLSLSLTAVIIVVFGNQSVSIDTQLSNDALYKAEALLEAARSQSRQNFSSVVTAPTTTDSLYQKSLSVIDIDSSTKQVTGTVSWVLGGRTLYTLLSTLLTNPDQTNSCPSTLGSGDWKNPQHYDFDAASLVPGNNSNGLGIADIKVHSGKLYVAANSAPNNGHSFFVFTLPQSPNQAPVYLGSVNTDPAHAAGLAAVTVAKNGSNTYAYLANASSFAKGQLQIVDVTNPTTSGWSPTIVTFKLPTSVVPNAGLGNSIYYKNGYIYLGLTAAAGGKEFHIIDVHNPLSPVLRGSYSTNSHDINAIYVSGSYAYLATPNNEVLTVLDISNPSNPVRVSGYTPPNLPNSEGSGSDHGKSIFMLGSKLYLGRTYGSNEFAIFNAQTPAALSLLATKDSGTGNKTSINTLVVRGTLMFALTNAQFQVWDITNSASVLPWSSDGTTNSFLSLASLGGTGTNLDCGGNYFYTALASSQGNNKDVLSVIVPYVPSTYTLANSGDITVVQGSGGSNTITATLTGGLPTPVTFAASGLPAGASVNYSNNPCTVTCTNTLTISTTASTPAGTYPITVTGTNGVTTSFNLVVSPTFTYTLSASPGSITMSQGTTKQVTVTVTKTAGTAQSVTLSLSGLQNNTSLNPASLSCTPASGTCTATFNIIAASNAQKKTNTITVTGTSPTRTTTFTLTIQ